MNQGVVKSRHPPATPIIASHTCGKKDTPARNLFINNILTKSTGGPTHVSPGPHSLTCLASRGPVGVVRTAPSAHAYAGAALSNISGSFGFLYTGPKHQSFSPQELRFLPRR